MRPVRPEAGSRVLLSRRSAKPLEEAGTICASPCGCLASASPFIRWLSWT